MELALYREPRGVGAAPTSHWHSCQKTVSVRPRVFKRCLMGRVAVRGRVKSISKENAVGADVNRLSRTEAKGSASTPETVRGLEEKEEEDVLVLQATTNSSVGTDIDSDGHAGNGSANGNSEPLSRRLRGWLSWRSNKGVTLAKVLDRGSVDEELLFGDGMAASVPEYQVKNSFSRVIDGRKELKNNDLEVRSVNAGHPALQLLRQRFLSSSKPGERRDPFKLGLVVEGGGMRGCVSGGALQAFADLGLLPLFDATYGSSAGAINLSYFLSEQRDGVQIYHNYIANEEFIDIRRLFSRRYGQSPALNLDMLLHDVMENHFPLDWDRVINSKVPLKVVASSLDTLRPELLHSFSDKEDLRNSLRASATVPEVAGGPVEHRGHRFVDAAVFEAVPFRSAVADGCTHILVLCTRPPPALKTPWSGAFSDVFESAVKKAVLSPEYMVPAWKAELEAINKDGITQDEMLFSALEENAYERPWFAGSHVYPIYPAASGASFSPLCIDVSRIKHGVSEGRRSALTVARAALGDVLDFSRVVGQEAANIIPIAPSKFKSATTGSTAARSLREDYVFYGTKKSTDDELSQVTPSF